MATNKPVIGVVGPCSSGKSTLVSGLTRRGYFAKNIAQEHSFVKDMWKRLTDPNILVFLNVSYQIAQSRRKLNWDLSEYHEQQRRLRHARQNADFYLNTDPLTPNEVLENVISFLEKHL
jgi:guanylate kinase